MLGLYLCWQDSWLKRWDGLPFDSWVDFGYQKVGARKAAKWRACYEEVSAAYNEGWFEYILGDCWAFLIKFYIETK